MTKPGQQQFTMIAGDALSSESVRFMELLAADAGSSQYVRSSGGWDYPIPACKACKLTITSDGETREVTLVLGDVSSIQEAVLSIKVSTLAKSRFTIVGNTLLLKSGLDEKQMKAAVNSVTAFVFRGQNWTDATGKLHQDSSGGIRYKGPRKRKAGGHNRPGDPRKPDVMSL